MFHSRVVEPWPPRTVNSTVASFSWVPHDVCAVSPCLHSVSTNIRLKLKIRQLSQLLQLGTTFALWKVQQISKHLQLFTFKKIPKHCSLVVKGMNGTISNSWLFVMHLWAENVDLKKNHYFLFKTSQFFAKYHRKSEILQSCENCQNCKTLRDLSKEWLRVTTKLCDCELWIPSQIVS